MPRSAVPRRESNSVTPVPRRARVYGFRRPCAVFPPTISSFVVRLVSARSGHMVFPARRLVDWSVGRPVDRSIGRSVGRSADHLRARFYTGTINLDPLLSARVRQMDGRPGRLNPVLRVAAQPGPLEKQPVYRPVRVPPGYTTSDSSASSPSSSSLSAPSGCCPPYVRIR